MSDRPILECRKCGHKWSPRDPSITPKICPSRACKSPNWNRERSDRVLTCLQCNATWERLRLDKNTLPNSCPQCGSRRWNRTWIKPSNPPEDPAKLYWSHVIKGSNADDCWGWNAKQNPYAKFKVRINGKPKHLMAHRFSWELHNGQIPEGLWVLHGCDTPACSNPLHLYLGDHKQNMADMMAKGRAANGDSNGSRKYPERLKRGDESASRKYPERFPRGVQHHNSKLTESSVREIRALFKDGATVADIQRMFSIVDVVTVSAVCHERTWRHVI